MTLVKSILSWNHVALTYAIKQVTLLQNISRIFLHILHGTLVQKYCITLMFFVFYVEFEEDVILEGIKFTSN